MRDLVPFVPSLPAMSTAAIRQVTDFETRLLAEPQLASETTHVLHAGMYSRTMRLAPGTVITGAQIKVPTLLVIHGDCMVWLGMAAQRITGFGTIPAAAGRKQVFRALTETHINMIFPTTARTVEEAEREFTDDHERLASRRSDHRNHVIITDAGKSASKSID